MCVECLSTSFLKLCKITIDYDCEVSGTKNNVNKAAKRQMLPKR